MKTVSTEHDRDRVRGKVSRKTGASHTRRTVDNSSTSDKPTDCGTDCISLEKMHALQVELGEQYKELLEAQARSEHDQTRFRTLFEVLPLPCLVLNRRGVAQIANRAAEALFGFDTSGMRRNRSVYRLFDADSASRLHAHLTGDGMTTGTSEQPDPTLTILSGLRLRQTTADASVFEAHLANLPTSYGEENHVQMLLVDRTAEVETARRQEIDDALLQSATPLIHAFDLEGNLVKANLCTRAHLGKLKTLSAAERQPFNNLLGSRALDIEVLVSGSPRSFHSTYDAPSGESCNFLIQKFPLRDRDGNVFAVGGVSTDVSELVENQLLLHQAFSQAAFLANRDPLTRLPNRSFFMERLQEEITCERSADRGIFLGFIDIDGFKAINDSMGHEVGDSLICAFAKRLEHALGSRGQVGRFGGDEFVLFLTDITARQAETLITNALDEIRVPYEIAETPILLTCSVGLSQYPRDARTAEDLVRAADMALYAAKSNGRNRIAHFEDSMRHNSERQLGILSALRRALNEDNFRLVLQPKFDIKRKDRIVGAEALLRWRDPKLGNLAPIQFLPLAEVNGLSNAIDLRVARLFCALQKKWYACGYHIPISINISARSLQNKEFAPTIISLLDSHALPAELLVLEITETELIQFSMDTKAQLSVLKQAGIRVSIDDFGTGYSSLRYLQEMSPSEIKIDRSFINEVDQPNGHAPRIVEAILGLAKSLEIETCAEGIETEAQYDWLSKKGCLTGQGYLVSRPLEIPDFEKAFL